ncbi:hypothetical protein D9M68_896530 [compost metagenome]
MHTQHFQIGLDARCTFLKEPTIIGFLKTRCCPIRGNDDHLSRSFEDRYIGAVVASIIEAFRAIIFCESTRLGMRRKIVFACRG